MLELQSTTSPLSHHPPLINAMHDSYNIKKNPILIVQLDFSLTVKAAPHESVIRTSQPKALVKAEKEAWFYSKVTQSSCATTSVII